MTPKNKRVACLLSLLLLASANAAPAAPMMAAPSASAPSPAPSSAAPTRPLSCAVTVSPRTLGAYTPPRVAASQPTADKVPSVIAGRVDLKVVARWPEAAASAAAPGAAAAVAPSSSPPLLPPAPPASSSPKSWRLAVDVPSDATVTWTTSNLALVGQEQGPAAKAATSAAGAASAAVAAAVASAEAAAAAAAAPSPSSQLGARATSAVDSSVALGPEQAPEMESTMTMEASSFSLSSSSSSSPFAAAPAPATDNAESDDNEASSFAPTSPTDEETAAPVVTPFLGERDAAVFDVVPASASIESDEDNRLAAARADPSSREKDPVIFEAQAAAAAKAAKAAAAYASAAAAATAAASVPSPPLPDALSSTRLVSYKVNASTADYEPRSVSLNGVKCNVSLAAGSFYASSSAEATASAESDGGSVPDPSATPAPTPSSSDLLPAGLTDPSLTPPTTTTPTPPPAPVEQPVSANGSQLIGVDGKPLTITG